MCNSSRRQEGKNGRGNSWQSICVLASWMKVSVDFGLKGLTCAFQTLVKRCWRSIPSTPITCSSFNKLTQSDSIAQFVPTCKRLLKSPLKDPFRWQQRDLNGSPVTRKKPQISAVFWQCALPRADGISVLVPASGCSFPSEIGRTTSIWIVAYLRLLKGGLCWHADPQFCVW